jgi:hypothetical protein
MGVDCYLRWDGFGKEDLTNSNYKSQITGYQDNGKCGYLRVSYGYDNYKEATSPFFWDWNEDIDFNEKIIKKFIEIVNALSDKEKRFKKELLNFAEFGRKLNKQGKKPKVHISY